MPNTLPISTSNFYEENNMLQHIRKAANTPSANLVEKAKAHLPYKQRENWFQGTGLGTGVGTQNLDFWPSDVLQPRRCKHCLSAWTFVHDCPEGPKVALNGPK